MSFGKMGARGGFGSLGVLGRAGTGVAAPNAPVLSLVSEVAGLLSLKWVIDQTVVAGDTLNRQVATDAGFTSIIDNTSHPITSGEFSTDQITASQYQAPANGTYYTRGSVTSAATGKTSAWSNVLTTVVSDMVTVPVNSVAPAISGNTQFGQTLTTTNGTWSNSPTGYTYQWLRGGSNISGATSSTYVLAEVDAGAAITCKVTASNAGGSGSPATSNSLSIDVYLVHTGAHPVDATDLTTYTFSSQSLGVAAANRIILIAVHGSNASGVSADISSVSVASNPATRVTELLADISSNRAVAIYAVPLAAGTSGNIVVTFGVGQSRCGVGIWAMYGASSATPSSTPSTASSPAGAPSMAGPVSVTVPAKGVALGLATSGGGATSCTWTGLTKRYDQAAETTNIVSGADLNSNAGGSISMSASWNTASSSGPAVFAAWGP